ncbi:MAG: hypothetical protein FJ029_15870, partial [Actinobacteria bacterium]|nr:hypothetical protein [Actinomycetota bacterium]
AQLWLDQGFVLSGDDQLVSATFIRARTPRFSNTDAEAGCVRVDLAWDAARHAVGRLGLKGGAVTIRG